MQEAVVDAAYLREMAEECLRLVNSINEPDAIAALRKMAMEYRIWAARFESTEELDGSAHPRTETGQTDVEASEELSRDHVAPSMSSGTAF